MRVRLRARAQVWKSQDNFKESVFSFHPEGSWEQTEVVRNGSKSLHRVSQLVGPSTIYMIFKKYVFYVYRCFACL